MACTVVEFKTRFPEFSDEEEYPTIRINVFIGDAATIYIGSDESRWGGKYNYVQCYVAAHLLTLASRTELGDVSASAGPVSSKSADGLSVSRSVVAVDRSEGDNFFMTTSYGQMFLSVRNTCFAGILVNNCQ